MSTTLEKLEELVDKVEVTIEKIRGIVKEIEKAKKLEVESR